MTRTHELSNSSSLKKLEIILLFNYLVKIFQLEDFYIGGYLSTICIKFIGIFYSGTTSCIEYSIQESKVVEFKVCIELFIHIHKKIV